MSAVPSLPPAYRLLRIPKTGDPFRRARPVAAVAAEDGVLVWSERRDRLDCAVVLVPDVPLDRSLLVAYVALLGLGDAFGALAPPMVAATFGWPDRLEVNGAVVGGVRLAVAEVDSAESVPAWMVAGVTVTIAADRDGAEPGHDVLRTTLEDEGCGEIAAGALLESFARHFLVWVNRWQEDGFNPIRETWMGRASGRAGRMEVALPDGRVAGRFAGIDDAGGLLLLDGGRTLTVPLARALSAPSWLR